MAIYPAEYDLDVVLRDGGVVHMRPITTDDGELLLGLFTRLGPQSRYFRFFRVKAVLDREEVQYFTSVDYENRMALVVLDGDEMVGVGRYDRLADEPTVAEVAFAVADEQQGRGIGTELLQMLTAHARKHGVEQFRAFVLPENVRMLRVFRNSGYSLARAMDDGMFIVDFPVAYTDDARAAAEEREKVAVAASILPLFFPRSVAVIGASTDPKSIGAKLFANLLREGFSGPLYPVNPHSLVVNSVRAYASVRDIPDAVDLAFIVVPAHLVVDIARECAEKRVRGIVVISAGFSEVGGEGARLETELLEVVRASGMRLVGPNCMGLLNTAASVKLNGTFAPVYPPAGNIAMSSQSGALGIAILDYARRNGLGISQFVSMGNKADVGGNDLLLAWEDDPDTDVILLYLESFGNPRRFARLARRIARKKPIVAVKSGRTRAGRRAASSHTGALASLDVAVDALFQQSGVIRTDTLEELFAVGTLLANQPVPRGRRVGIVTNAGGPAILAADALESQGLEIPELSEGLQARMRAVLPSEASTRNPVDLIASGGPDEFRHCLGEVLNSGEVDALMAIYVPTSPEGSGPVAEAICEVCDAYEGPTTMLSVLMQQTDGRALQIGTRRRVPTFLFPEGAARALARTVRYGEWLRRDPGTIPEPEGVEPDATRAVVEQALQRLGEEGGWLEPFEVEALLDAVGIRRARSQVVGDEEQAVAASARFGGPVAVKVVATTTLHKSDVGGVVLDVQGEEAVRAAYRQVIDSVPDAEGALVQEMVAGGHEVLVGMSEDPSFGPMIVFGLGGVSVELLRDVSFRLHPLTDVDAHEMVRAVKGFSLLEGYRSFPPGDVAAVEDVILRVSSLIGVVPELREMDLNPIKVLDPGKGATVVDARMRVEPLSPEWSPELVDLPGVARPRREATG